ncbi:hypothetical protein [Mariluticola halotolerans]|uniref:hypothetical protein n=1 Tax=Mariluticola halotolerans TaxID=2909283 RepID=UPI0026E23671|nr:hypothetical protein [Mariluticola halotolerans]UJQ95498.1 hypothetical protein L1P08_05785 [Mariluticola halotolerans]
MDSARFILERLNWPVRFARLQAAREYAKLLGDPSFGATALQTYLSWLGERRTENETCSGLAVLLTADSNHLPSLSTLTKKIACPSILADFILKEVYGPLASLDDWASQHCDEVPPSFESSEYFLRNRTSQVPSSLGDELTRLEQMSSLPFMRQWGFEWENTRSTTDAPHSGFPYHFLETSLERSGVSVQIDQRQGDIYRSAYLRTLHCAVDLWGMPLDVAYTAASKCLPLNRGLVDIERVDRPHWLGALPDLCADEDTSLEPVIREILKAGTASGSLVPVHIKTPLSLSIAEFSSLTVSCTLLSDDYIPLPETDIADLGGSAWELPTGTLFFGQPSQLKAEDRFRPAAQGKCLPLCVEIFPFPFGYWLGDLFHLGLSLPASYAFSQPISYRCADGGIITKVGQQPVGRWTTWNDHWTNLYPKGGNSRCGCLSEMRRDEVAAAAHRLGLRVGWTADIKIWHREKSYGDLMLSRKSVHFFDDGEIV